VEQTKKPSAPPQVVPEASYDLDIAAIAKPRQLYFYSSLFDAYLRVSEADLAYLNDLGPFLHEIPPGARVIKTIQEGMAALVKLKTRATKPWWDDPDRGDLRRWQPNWGECDPEPEK